MPPSPRRRRAAAVAVATALVAAVTASSATADARPTTSPAGAASAGGVARPAPAPAAGATSAGGAGDGDATAPPSAGGDLRDATPGDGAALTTAPGSVRLTFDDPVFPGSARVSVRGPGGEVTSGFPEVHGHDVTVRLRDGLPVGSYTVRYRVGFLPGARGGYSFTLSPPTTPTTATTPDSPSPPSTPGPPGPAPTRTTTPAPVRTAPPHHRTTAAVPRTTSPTRTRPATTPAGPTPGPSAAAPQAQGVSFVGEEDLPSPTIIWVLLGLTIVVGSLIARARRSRE